MVSPAAPPLWEIVQEIIDLIPMSDTSPLLVERMVRERSVRFEYVLTRNGYTRATLVSAAVR